MNKDKTFFTVGFERIKDVRPRFDAGANVWTPTAALRSDSLGVLAEHHDLRSAHAHGDGRPVHGTAVPRQHHPGRPDQPGRAEGARVLRALPKGPGLTGNIFDATLPETAIWQLDDGPRRPEGLEREPVVRAQELLQARQQLQRLHGQRGHRNFQFISYQGVIDDVHVFNPTTVLNVRYGYNRFERNSGQQPEYVSDFDLTRLGFLAVQQPGARDEPRLPAHRVPQHGRHGLRQRLPADHHALGRGHAQQDAGRALAEGGLELRIYREDSLPTGNARSGRYVFNNTYTRQNSASGTGFEGLQGYAAFLLGLPSTLEISRLADYSEYSKTYGLFVQDDWRVNSKLTLNLGLRWEVETPLVERNGKSVSGFDFGYAQPIQSSAQQRYAALNDPALKALVPQLNVTGGLLFAEKDVGSGLYGTPKNVFLPRFGFAYQWNPKTVIRGGAGLFAGFLGQRRGDVIPNGWSQTTTSPPPTPAGRPSPTTGRTPSSPTRSSSRWQRQRTPAGLGTGISFFNQDPGVSKQLRWQIGFQRQLPAGFTVDAAYVGNHGYDIEINRNINALPRRVPRLRQLAQSGHDREQRS